MLKEGIQASKLSKKRDFSALIFWEVIPRKNVFESKEKEKLNVKIYK